MDESSKVMVCDACKTASCWHSGPTDTVCDNYKTAGLAVMTVAQLRKLGLEHEDNWSDETMIEVYGNADRNFP